MDPQADAWSRAAEHYAAKFIDPYRSDVKSPLFNVLERIPNPEAKVAADLGCGMGPLLPFLAKRFQEVIAVDFADAMLAKARECCRDCTNIEFIQRSFTDLAPLAGRVNVAVSINSLVMPDVRDIDRALLQIHECLKPRGWFLGIVPSIDAVHYHTMLLLDRALTTGKPLEAARKNAAHLADHADFAFAFGDCRFDGLEQHFWQPFELRHRLKKAGFRHIRLAKVHLSWKQFTWSRDLKSHPPPWDWFFLCRRA